MRSVGSREGTMDGRFPLTAAERRTRAAQIFVGICLMIAVIGVALLVARL